MKYQLTNKNSLTILRGSLSIYSSLPELSNYVFLIIIITFHVSWHHSMLLDTSDTNSWISVCDLLEKIWEYMAKYTTRRNNTRCMLKKTDKRIIQGI